MPRGRLIRSFLVLGVIAAASGLGAKAPTVADTKEPTNDASNPYRTIEHWAKLPDGRKMGSTSAIDIDRDGKSIWVAERCGANSCLDRETGEIKNIPVILKFD